MSRRQTLQLITTKPTRLGRFADAVRGYFRGGMTGDEMLAMYRDTTGAVASSGVTVSEVSALNNAAVYAAVNLLSADVSTLPLNFLRRLPNGGKEKYTKHPLYFLLHDQPNDEQTSIVWRRMLQAHVLTWGNGYSEIIRNGAGQPVELWPITPDRVTPFRQAPNAPLQYRVIQPAGGTVVVDGPNMIHLTGLGFDGTCGYSVIAKARESIGLGLAAEQFGGAFFGNGATFGGVISYPGARPNELAEKNYRESLQGQHQGVSRAHKFLLLYGGAKYERLGIPPDDAQFLQTRQFQVGEIARWFNLPPHKLGDLARSTHSNIEQQEQDYLTHSLLPWLRVWEQELTLKLVAPLEQGIQFVEHNVDGLLRGDSTARGDFYSKQFSVASVTPNEIRDFENRNPIEGGDRSFVALNLIPLDRMDEWVDAQIDERKSIAEKNRMPPPTPAPPPQPDEAAAQRMQELADLTAERDSARATVEAQVAQLIERGQRIEALTADVKTVQDAAATALQAAHDARVAATAAETLVRARDETIVVLNASVTDLAHTVETEREAFSLDLSEAQKETQRANDRTVEADKARATAESALAELRPALQNAAAAADAAERDLAALRESCAGVQATVELREAEAASALGALRRVERQLEQTTDAIRADVAGYVARYLVDRESDRARGAQGSPEKLSKWAETYYGAQDDYLRQALRPVAHVWLTATGSSVSVESVLDTVVPAYIDDGRRQLQQLASETTTETLAPKLERVLRRWETDRVERLVRALADALTAKDPS